MIPAGGKMTLKEIDDVLAKKGYPSRQDLQAFPLGEMLLALDSSAWTSNGRVVELYEKENPNSRDLGRDEQDLSVSELEERLREQERILHNERITEVYRHHIMYMLKASGPMNRLPRTASFFSQKIPQAFSGRPTAFSGNSSGSRHCITMSEKRYTANGMVFSENTFSKPFRTTILPNCGIC
jgi:hypothetical protein